MTYSLVQNNRVTNYKGDKRVDVWLHLQNHKHIS